MKKLSGTYFNYYLSRLFEFAEARTFRFHDISSYSYDNIIMMHQGEWFLSAYMSMMTIYRFTLQF